MLRSCKQHPSVGCCLPFTAFRSSIGGQKDSLFAYQQQRYKHRSNTFVLIPLLELTLAVAQHHAGFIFKITLVCENVLSPCFFDCLFIDSFCDLCPTRHHKRGASRDYSQQNSSIALLLSPCFRGDERLASEGVIVWGGLTPPLRCCRIKNWREISRQFFISRDYPINNFVVEPWLRSLQKLK